MARSRQQSKKRKRRGRPVPILLALLAVVILAVVLKELRRPGEDPGERTMQYVDVNDGVNWIRIIPAEGVAVSDLTELDFRTENGVTRYVGTGHSVRQGVDVSDHQEEIDWPAVTADGIDFAVIRLGYRGYTEGLIHSDKRFEENYQGALEAGVDIGVYFFSQALDEDEAAEEAEFVLQTLERRHLDLPVFFDWEPAEEEGARSGDMDGDTLTACAKAFCRRIEQGGYRAGIYFNRQQGYHDYDLSVLKDYVFWVSDPNEWTDFYYAVSLWQYSFDGHVDGITGRIDRDMFFD